MFHALPLFFHIVTLLFLLYVLLLYLNMLDGPNKVTPPFTATISASRNMRNAGKGLKQRDETGKGCVFNANEAILLLSVSVEAAEQPEAKRTLSFGLYEAQQWIIRAQLSKIHHQSGPGIWLHDTRMNYYYTLVLLFFLPFKCSMSRATLPTPIYIRADQDHGADAWERRPNRSAVWRV